MSSTLSLSLLSVLLYPRVVMPVRVPSTDQIDLLKHSNSIGPCAKKKTTLTQHKNVNMNAH